MQFEEDARKRFGQPVECFLAESRVQRDGTEHCLGHALPM